MLWNFLTNYYIGLLNNKVPDSFEIPYIKKTDYSEVLSVLLSDLFESDASPVFFGGVELL